MDTDRMESMWAAIQRGMTLDQARRQRLVRTAEEAAYYAELEDELARLRRLGRLPDTPNHPI